MVMMPEISPNEKNQTWLTDRQIYIVGSRKLQNELMAFFLERDTGAECLLKEDLEQIPVSDNKQEGLPKLILAECFEMDLNICLSRLEKAEKMILSDHMLAIFNVPPDQGIEEKAVALGVRGVFYDSDPLERFSKGINAVIDGELWVSREILTKYVMRNTEQGDENGHEESILTARETEILAMISAGEKNEEIAEKLFISPNTVKTHIYNIFKKIDVPNRLQAALWAVKNL